MNKRNIAVFASGNGSNAENIIRYFNTADDSAAQVRLIVCNKKDAFVVTRAHKFGIPVEIVTKEKLNDSVFFLGLLQKYDIDFIALAGFLLMVPSFVIAAFADRIVNIHPSLLPKFGGRGMYGHRIHEAVVSAGEKETGITIHKVSDVCDQGQIVFQATVKVNADDTPDDVERKIHELERTHYPAVLRKLLEDPGCF